jgi:hypothetical protein
MDEPWSFEHSVVCPVSLAVAWQFWTTVDNWRLDADVESVQLDGPFAAGARGTTVSRRSGRIEWRIAAVEGTSAVIEIPAGNAVGQFRWSFTDLGGRTRITQVVSLAGEGAAALAEQFAAAFEANLPAGMEKLCESMAAASSADRQ